MCFLTRARVSQLFQHFESSSSSSTAVLSLDDVKTKLARPYDRQDLLYTSLSGFSGSQVFGPVSPLFKFVSLLSCSFSTLNSHIRVLIESLCSIRPYEWISHFLIFMFWLSHLSLGREKYCHCWLLLVSTVVYFLPIWNWISFYTWTDGSSYLLLLKKK